VHCSFHVACCPCVLQVVEAALGLLPFSEKTIITPTGQQLNTHTYCLLLIAWHSLIVLPVSTHHTVSCVLACLSAVDAFCQHGQA
jgi:hypothetical protein